MGIILKDIDIESFRTQEEADRFAYSLLGQRLFVYQCYDEEYFVEWFDKMHHHKCSGEKTFKLDLVKEQDEYFETESEAYKRISELLNEYEFVNFQLYFEDYFVASYTLEWKAYRKKETDEF